MFLHPGQALLPEAPSNPLHRVPVPAFWSKTHARAVTRGQDVCRTGTALALTFLPIHSVFIVTSNPCLVASRSHGE